MEPIICLSELQCLTSEKPYYILRVKETKEYDLYGIELKTVPEHLEEVRIWIGNSVVATFPKEEVESLKTFPIYLSWLPYMVVRIELVYDIEWLKKKECFEMEEDYCEKIEYEAGLIEIFDGYEYHTGQRVIRDSVPLGTKKRVITSPVIVEIPPIYLHRQLPMKPFIGSFQHKSSEQNVPSSQITQCVPTKIYLDNYTEEELARYKEKYQLKKINDTIGILQNELLYHGGMAGLKYVF